MVFFVITGKTSKILFDCYAIFGDDELKRKFWLVMNP